MDKQGRDMVPITGENYRQFLELWKEKGLKGWATMQPNWLGAFAVYAAVQALEGKDVPAFVKVPLPVIDECNIDEYLAAAEIPGRRLHLFGLQPGDVRQAALQVVWRVADVHREPLRHDGGGAAPRGAGIVEGLLRQPRAAGVSIALRPGRVHALLGENGAGNRR